MTDITIIDSLKIDITQFSTILSNLEESEYTVWEGRVVTDKTTNYSYENLLNIFNEIKNKQKENLPELISLQSKLVALDKSEDDSFFNFNKIKEFLHGVFSRLTGTYVNKEEILNLPVLPPSLPTDSPSNVTEEKKVEDSPNDHLHPSEEDETQEHLHPSEEDETQEQNQQTLTEHIATPPNIETPHTVEPEKQQNNAPAPEPEKLKEQNTSESPKSALSDQQTESALNEKQDDQPINKENADTGNDPQPNPHADIPDVDIITVDNETVDNEVTVEDQNIVVEQEKPAPVSKIKELEISSYEKPVSRNWYALAGLIGGIALTVLLSSFIAPNLLNASSLTPCEPRPEPKFNTSHLFECQTHLLERNNQLSDTNEKLLPCESELNATIQKMDTLKIANLNHLKALVDVSELASAGLNSYPIFNLKHKKSSENISENINDNINDNSLIDLPVGSENTLNNTQNILDRKIEVWHPPLLPLDNSPEPTAAPTAVRETETVSDPINSETALMPLLTSFENQFPTFDLGPNGVKAISTFLKEGSEEEALTLADYFEKMARARPKDISNNEEDRWRVNLNAHVTKLALLFNLKKFSFNQDASDLSKRSRTELDNYIKRAKKAESPYELHKLYTTFTSEDLQLCKTLANKYESEGDYELAMVWLHPYILNLNHQSPTLVSYKEKVLSKNSAAMVEGYYAAMGLIAKLYSSGIINNDWSFRISQDSIDKGNDWKKSIPQTLINHFEEYWQPPYPGNINKFPQFTE